MAVCVRESVLIFYAVFAGVFSTFWENKNKKHMGRAVFQGRARMITN